MSHPERSHSQEILSTLSVIFGIVALSQFAFSIGPRREIGERDKWTCQSCGKSFAKGWMVHAAHKPKYHDPKDPLYDTAKAGDIECISCHIAQHEKGTALGSAGDQGALNLLQGLDKRTFAYRAAHPKKEA